MPGGNQRIDMSARKLIVLLCFVVLWSADCAWSQQGSERFVYMVSIPQTPGHKSSIQTGFRLAGTKGIITSLHGVVDGTIFTAFNEQGDVLTGLRLVRVDIPNDLALLRSDELEKRDDEGLVRAETLSPHPGDIVHILGHPVGINLLNKTVHIGSPPIKVLAQLIPPASAQAFGARRSPAADIRVISLDANLVPGDSGAPVISNDNKVLGVVDGGLLGGAAAISWAIPLDVVQWQDAGGMRPRLQELSSLATTNLFALQENIQAVDADIIVSGNGDGNYQSLGDAVAHANPGARIVVRSGLYRERVSISKSLTIVGDGPAEDVVIAGVSPFQIGANASVRLEKLTIQAPRGISDVEVDGRLVMESCEVSAGNVGVTINPGGTARISNSDFSSSDSTALWAIFVDGGTAVVDHCKITGFGGAGILVDAGTANISQCAITLNKTGVDIGYRGTAIVHDSDLRGNKESPTHFSTATSGADGSQLIGVLVDQNNKK